MKHLGAVLAGGLTLLIILAVGIFSFLSTTESPQPAEAQAVTVEMATEAPVIGQAVAPVTLDASQIETNLTHREAIYQAQITQLDQALQERQATYQTQIQLLNTQVTTAQNQLNELKAQEQSLLAQIAELEATRAERLTIYRTQLEQARNQYEARFAEMQALFNEIQVKLAEASAQLGR